MTGGRGHILMLLLLVLAPWAKAAPDQEQIVVGKGFGPYRAALGETGLQALVDESEIGYESQGFTLFFLQTERRIQVEIDQEGRVRKMVIHGARSVWHTPEGITLGSTLGDLEAANGKPFRFQRFQGERGGVVLDWQGGRLRGLDCVLASPFQSSNYGQLSETEKLALENPGVMSSDEALARKLNPVVETLGLSF